MSREKSMDQKRKSVLRGDNPNAYHEQRPSKRVYNKSGINSRDKKSNMVTLAIGSFKTKKKPTLAKITMKEWNDKQ